ncbi:hypothetical protein DENIS_3506 [Desulfonema ishimotonii]|uniref:Oxaloacetate decarboxylase, gamma chain n=1 Tax=Desulfonema ishimotonii TaxID=45657 RepID=A0A401FZY5_9BACT|nr:OadG family protein [Desulfonema ishimotonii]GBC62534.1 hypothetical protein DENIS_3506 [Desulfonema ishimotonii]
MTGLEAINAHNGWSIAVLGISIVFTGLTLLSATISQLYKILEMWENRDEYFKRKREALEKAQQAPAVCVVLPGNIKESARQFRLLINHMGEPFALPKLLDYARRCGLERPHSSLNDLILSKAIVPDAEGYYSWNKNVSH